MVIGGVSAPTSGTHLPFSAVVMVGSVPLPVERICDVVVGSVPLPVERICLFQL